MRDAKRIALDAATMLVWSAWAYGIWRLVDAAIHGPAIAILPAYLLFLWLLWSFENWSMHRYFEGGSRT